MSAPCAVAEAERQYQDNLVEISDAVNANSKTDYDEAVAELSRDEPEVVNSALEPEILTAVKLEFQSE